MNKVKMSKIAIIVTLLPLLAVCAFAETVTSDVLHKGKDTFLGGMEVPGYMRVRSATVLDGANKGANLVGEPYLAAKYLDDFFSFVFITNDIGPWKITSDTHSQAAASVIAGAGGQLQVLTGSTDNNEVYLSLGQNATEGAFNITASGGKEVWYETRVKTPTINTQAGLFVGLAAVDANSANFIVDNTGVLDTNRNWVGFQMATNALSWNFSASKADAAAGIVTITNVNTFAAAAFTRLGFRFDGVSGVTVYVNGVRKGRQLTWDSTSYPDATALTPFIAAKTLAASTAATNLVDYISIQQER